MSIENYMLRNADTKKLTKLGFVEGTRVTEMYKQIYQLYTSLLLQYLDKLLGLREKEEQIKNSFLQLQPIKEEDKDAYQSLSPLEFFYVRNDLKIESITQEYLRLLQKRCENKNYQLDAIAEQIIRDTCMNVVTNTKYKKGTRINYGPSTKDDYFAPNDSIVLGLRRNPEYDKGREKKDNPEWVEMFFKKEMLMQALKKLIEEEAAKKGIPLEVIVYDENSVTKRIKQEQVKK